MPQIILYIALSFGLSSSFAQEFNPYEFLKPQESQNRIIKINKEAFQNDLKDYKEHQRVKREEAALAIKLAYLERQKAYSEKERLNNELKKKELLLKQKENENLLLSQKRTKVQEKENALHVALLNEKEDENKAKKKLEETKALEIENAKSLELSKQESVARLEMERKMAEDQARVSAEIAKRNAIITAEVKKENERKLAEVAKENAIISEINLTDKDLSNEVNVLKAQIKSQQELIEKNNELLLQLNERLQDPKIKKAIEKELSPKKKIF